MNYRNIKGVKGLLYKPSLSYWALETPLASLNITDLQKTWKSYTSSGACSKFIKNSQINNAESIENLHVA